MALMYGVSLWSFLYLLFGFTPMNKHKCPALTLHKHPLIERVDCSPQDRFVCKKLWVSPRSGPRPKLDSSFSGRGMIVSPSPTLARIPQRVMSRWKSTKSPSSGSAFPVEVNTSRSALPCIVTSCQYPFSSERAQHVSQHRHSLITVRVSLYTWRTLYEIHRDFPCSVFVDKFYNRFIPVLRYFYIFSGIGSDPPDSSGN